ncbi:hypothetical protein WICPIJ_006354 [Wickerhamomyces pijperi]|uniref:ABC transporter domain-containing protein n=1 Tax=Wickerhamomyces pijperi TaxID=599730 RepID=A0A9P8Q294_WICPI|nr:hypothetical protein WICPIJ_006354 [Wickerhamomyces pijperi]
MTTPTLAIATNHLSYKYANGSTGLADITLQLPWGTRTLLIGSNGAGKSTLLKLLAGKTLSSIGEVLIGGHDPFRGGSDATHITTYLGTEWASNPIVRRDIPVTVLIDSVGGSVFPERRDLLVKLLDVDLRWRMHQVSDGERRRVQLVMGLLKPWKVLLLDEVTVDLDVQVRYELLDFLKQETEERECSIIYATHIFDGLGNWPTNVVHIQAGRVLKNLDYQKDISFVDGSADEKNGSSGDLQESFKFINEQQLLINKIKSLHPLALDWLVNDLSSRGTRVEDKNRVKWDDLKSQLEKFYDGSSDRITEYFKRNRTS